MKRFNLRWKILLPTLVLILAGVAVILISSTWVFSGTMTDINEDYNEQMGWNFARQFEGKMNGVLYALRSVSSGIQEDMQDLKHTRQSVLLSLSTAVKEYSEVAGVYACINGDAFLAKTEFVGSSMTDSSDRFVPLVARNAEDKVLISSLTGTNDDDPMGEFYRKTVELNNYYVTDPFQYEVNGESKLCIFMSIPVHSPRGEVVGIVGGIVLMEEIDPIFRGATVYDTGDLTLFSPGGLVSYYNDAEKLGLPAGEIGTEDMAAVIDQVSASGEAQTINRQDRSRGTEMVSTFLPVNIGGYERSWVLGVNAPVNEVMEPVYRSFFISLGVTLLVVLVVLLVLSNLITKTVKPILQVVDAADKLAVGDVNISLTSDRQDEVGKLVSAFNRTIENIREQCEMVRRVADGDLTVKVIPRSDKDMLGHSLYQMVRNNRKLVTEISQAGDMVSGSAKQIAAGSQALAQGTVEQASAIEELSSTVEHVAKRTQENSEYAGKANSLVSKVREDADKSNGQMGQMVESVKDINKSSADIAKIIKVIDDIAFQTNILALNAAVEAARAGQHGKGFAVVAQEVRNLASRSAAAAADTAELIEKSVTKAEHGMRIAQQTATSLQAIAGQVEQAASLMNDIASASQEQNRSIEQIHTGVSQISAVMQSNGATAEESAAASHELDIRAQELKELLSSYKVGEGDSMPDSRPVKKENLPAVVELPEDEELLEEELSAEAAKQEEAPAEKEPVAPGGFGKY